MNTINLSKGQVALVDASDYAYLSQHRWYLGRGGYAVRAEYLGKVDGKYKQKTVSMHRELLRLPSGIYVDHINRDKLDNRRSNLRACTFQQNNHNKPKQSNNTSGFIGVTRYKKRWRAYCYLDNKLIHLAVTDDPAEAAYIRDQVVMQLFGEFANTNFSYP